MIDVIDSISRAVSASDWRFLKQSDSHMNIMQALFGGVPDESEQYMEGAPGYFKTWNFDHFFTVKTPAGFMVHVRARGMLDRIDDAAFKKAEMLVSGKIDELSFKYCDTALGKVIPKRGFVALAWPAILRLRDGRNVFYPTVSAFRCEEDEDGGIYDPNASGIVNASRKIKFEENGCTCYFTSLDKGIWTRELVEENYNMIPKELVESVEACDPNYRMACEYAVATAMKRVLEIEDEFSNATLEQKHNRPHFSLTTRCLDSGRRVELRWTIGERVLEIMGFRTTDQFSEDPWAESTNGHRIFHSKADGALIEELPSGETYRYTILVKNQKWEPLDWTRFSVAMPSEAQRKIIEERRQELLGRFGTQQPKSKLAQRIQTMIDDMGIKAELMAITVQKSNERLEEIRKQKWFKELSQNDQDNVIDYVHHLREGIQYTLRGV